jgi:phosphatidylcholine synthase
MRTALAWLVHLYTSLGLICAARIAALIVRGGDEDFRACFLLMLIATLIDATDGWLARAVDVSRYTPGFDGRRLDDLIDFNTYTTLPVLLMWRAGLVPPGFDWIYLLPLLASAYGFSQVNAKTEDDYFLGFPSYWNITAFYLYLLSAPGWFNAGILIGLALLTFVPSLYLYPTKGATLRTLTNVLGAAWCVSLLVILVQWRTFAPALFWGSLLFPVYYFVVSWAVTIRRWSARS